MIIDKFIKLGFFPTPLEKLNNLSALFTDYNLFIKRDDQTGLASGGNKTRKLEYLINEAIREDCDTVITAGAQQSNHCRQTAAAAAKTGLKCHLLLAGKEPDKYNGNLLLSKLLGAKIHWTGENRKGEDLIRIEHELRANGNNPYIIPYGGSSEIGALGFVRAAGELAGQLTEMNIEMDYIFFASSSGGTQAGLTIGKELYKLKSELIGISIDKEDNAGQSLQKYILDIIEKCKKQTAINRDFSIEEIRLISGYDSSGYGIITENEKKAINLMAQKEGIILDPVYTARAFYGMLDYLNNKKLKPGSNILFWHTGGLPASFYYAEALSD